MMYSFRLFQSLVLLSICWEYLHFKVMVIAMVEEVMVIVMEGVMVIAMVGVMVIAMEVMVIAMVEVMVIVMGVMVIAMEVQLNLHQDMGMLTTTQTWKVSALFKG